ncbi:hypothetical protein [Sphingomonas sp. SUN039]|uniref:hypothetical protein n=1 Tax=Sphingomonas sp. SUN039 TaxID=2937787 RepID=UPI00216473EB|nr:hypothetical protein [Sphingomonas sp. SUN039]UVO53806.1 hypothetical protein M0209_06605 [Sphingomonas sp. SUN039]
MNASEPSTTGVWIPLQDAIRHFARAYGQLDEFEHHLLVLTSFAQRLYFAALLFSWFAFVVAVFATTSLYFFPRHPIGWLGVISATAAILLVNFIWVRFPHSRTGHQWLNRRLAPPPVLASTFRQMRSGDITASIGTESVAELLTNAFSALLCSHDEHIRKLVRTRHNATPRHSVSVFMVQTSPGTRAAAKHAKSRSIRAPRERATMPCMIVPETADKNAAGDGAISPERTANLPGDPLPSHAKSNVRQLYDYDWVRSLGVTADETAARVQALALPAEEAEPRKVRAGLEHALVFLIENPTLSLQNALDHAEEALDREFGSAGKRRNAKGAPWLRQHIKYPPAWLREGMKIPSAPPPFGAFLALPIALKPKQPGNSSTSVDKDGDGT